MKANKLVSSYRPKSRYKQMTSINLKIEKKPWELDNPKWRADFENEILESSNVFRARHHSPPLTTNAEIAKIAQDWANYLAKINKTIHRPDNRYGENIFYKWHRKHLISGVEVSQSFYNEIKYYYPYFQKEPNLEHFHRFGHFSQMLWRETEEMGTGIAVSGDKIFVVINYHPRGNWPDEYAMNVLPVAITSVARLNLIKSNPHPDHHNYIPPALRGKVDATPKTDNKELPPIVPVVATPIQPATESGNDGGATSEMVNCSEYPAEQAAAQEEGAKEGAAKEAKDAPAKEAAAKDAKVPAVQTKPAATDISKVKQDKKSKDTVAKSTDPAAADAQKGKAPAAGKPVSGTVAPRNVVKKDTVTAQAIAQNKAKVQRAKMSHPAQSSVPAPTSSTAPASSTAAPASNSGSSASSGSAPASSSGSTPNPMEFNPDGEKTIAAGLGTLQTIRVRSKPPNEQQTKPNSMATKFDEEKNVSMSKT